MGRPRSLRRQEFGCRSSQWSLLKALAAGDVPHPALGTLADGGSQPIVEDPSSERGVWSVGGRPTIADGQGQAIYRGGGEAIRRAEQQENDQLVERLGRRMKELFAGLTLKQEEDNRRLKEENLAIRKQMLELEKEKWEQHNRTELRMGALLRQMGGQALPAEPGSVEVTPVRGSRPAMVIPEMPSTQQKQARPGMLAPQGTGANGTASAVSPGGLRPRMQLSWYRLLGLS